MSSWHKCKAKNGLQDRTHGDKSCDDISNIQRKIYFLNAGSVLAPRAPKLAFLNEVRCCGHG